ncbi:MAG: glycosyltransferase family 4 protein [Candidatus Altiarchaeota archaeon]
MRIAFVYDVIYPYVKGGVEKRIWELSRRLAARGHDVHVYGMRHWAGPSTIKSGGITYHGVCRPMGLYKESGRRSIRQALYFTFWLPFSLFRERYDIVDCQAAPYLPTMMTRLYSFLTGVPLVVTWHEYWGAYWSRYLGLLGSVGMLLEYVCARLSDRAFSVSENTRRRLEKMGVKSVDAPNGVDMAYIRDTKPAEESDIIFVGRLIKDKNVDLLIDAVSLVRERNPPLRVIIVGVGPERDRLEKKANNQDLSHCVEFIGNQPYERVIGLMKSSKAFAFPSTREGFGIVALEANACGLPVVTVRHERNAAADLIEDGANGFVVPPEVKPFAEALLKILQDEKLRKDMYLKSLNKAAGYDWDKVAGMLEKEYGRILPPPAR